MSERVNDQGVRDDARVGIADEASSRTHPGSMRLRCRAVDVHFGRVRALDALDLDVEPGESLGLVGRNGAGKSTLIRAIARLQPLGNGSIEASLEGDGISPRVIRSRTELLRHVGVVPDELSAWDWMRVGQVIDLVASVQPRFDRAWCDELLSLLRLDPQARVKSLSRGTRARVAFLLGVAHKPALLLMDEPLLGVDAPSHDAILSAIAALRHETGCTVVISSHQLGDLARIADRIALIERGRIVECERVETILAESRRLVIRPAPTPDAIALPGGATILDRGADALVLSVRREAERLAAELRERLPGASVTSIPLSLHDAFADRLRVLEVPA